MSGGTSHPPPDDNDTLPVFCVDIFPVHTHVTCDHPTQGFIPGHAGCRGVLVIWLQPVDSSQVAGPDTESYTR